MSISNLKIAVRLGLAFAIMLTLLLLVLGLGLNALARNERSLNEIVNNGNVKVNASYDMENQIRVVSHAIDTIVLGEDAGIPEARNRLAGARAKYGQARELLNQRIRSEEGKAKLATVAEAIAVAAPLNNRAIELRMQGNKAEAAEILEKQVTSQTQKIFAALENIVEHEKTLAQKSADEAAAAYVQSRNLMVGIGVLAVVLGSLIGWHFTRSITRPIGAAVLVAERVAAGDLTVSIDVTTRDETGQLLQALKAMNDGLQNIVGQVRAGTHTIVTASSQIAAGNMDLSSRTEEQASSLEETASSMEELTSTVKQNAQNAQQANQLARAASEVALKGGEVVSRVVDTMSAINTSSNKIVDIIGVIDGIAFQTNILALNAAVEAARAGEQGRGFAVVASEVRNLAQRSAAAAREVKALISDSVEKVESGTKLVDEAGGTMQEIVTGIRRVTDIMAEISAASIEQTSGIEQINLAVAQMDQVTQQNASLVEEAAAAAESLNDQAGKLDDIVAVFKIDAGHGVVAAQKTVRSSGRAEKARLPVPAGRNGRTIGKTATAMANAAPARSGASAGNGGDWEEF